MNVGKRCLLSPDFLPASAEIYPAERGKKGVAGIRRTPTLLCVQEFQGKADSKVFCFCGFSPLRP